MGEIKKTLLPAVFSSERKQSELDIEFNKQGSISLLVSQEAAASHSRGLQHFPNNPPHPLQWEQAKVDTCTIEIKMVQQEVLDQRSLSV